jgi:hypothetical protein
MFYSKQTGGFYDTAIHGDNIPNDVVEITAEEHQALIDGQSQGKLIQADANGRPVLVDPPKTTAAEVWDRIKARRDAAKAGGVKVGTKWFHTDEASRIQYLALHMMGASIPANLQWKTLDGTFVTMTATLAKQVFQAVATLDMTAFAKAEEHRVAMEASADPASYDHLSGWPAAYGE